MCGRYVISKPVSKTVDLVKTNIKVEDEDNFNAHPSQKLPVIKSYTNGKALELSESSTFIFVFTRSIVLLTGLQILYLPHIIFFSFLFLTFFFL